MDKLWVDVKNGHEYINLVFVRRSQQLHGLQVNSFLAFAIFGAALLEAAPYAEGTNTEDYQRDSN